MDTVRPLRRWFATNQNLSAFASKIPTVTEPTGDGIINLANNDLVPERIKIWPLLLGANNDVTSMRLIGWHRALLDTKLDIWIPSTIAEIVCTASQAIGIAASAVLDTERFCDTLAPVALMTRDYKIAAATSIMSDYQFFTPANDTAGYLIFPVAGFEKLEITTDQTTGTSTFNALYTFLNNSGIN